MQCVDHFQMVVHDEETWQPSRANEAGRKGHVLLLPRTTRTRQFLAEIEFHQNLRLAWRGALGE